MSHPLAAHRTADPSSSAAATQSDAVPSQPRPGDRDPIPLPKPGRNTFSANLFQRILSPSGATKTPHVFPAIHAIKRPSSAAFPASSAESAGVDDGEKGPNSDFPQQKRHASESHNATHETAFAASEEGHATTSEPASGRGEGFDGTAAPPSPVAFLEESATQLDCRSSPASHSQDGVDHNSDSSGENDPRSQCEAGPRDEDDRLPETQGRREGHNAAEADLAPSTPPRQHHAAATLSHADISQQLNAIVDRVQQHRSTEYSHYMMLREQIATEMTRMIDALDASYQQSASKLEQTYEQLVSDVQASLDSIGKTEDEAAEFKHKLKQFLFVVQKFEHLD